MEGEGAVSNETVRWKEHGCRGQLVCALSCQFTDWPPSMDVYAHRRLIMTDTGRSIARLSDSFV